MGLGHQEDHQGKLFLAFDEIPRSRGHAFYDRLQQVLRQFQFDVFVEKLCQPYYADKGRPSIPPGRYFRMHFVGYFEGIDSERGFEWRCADSLFLREFLQLASHESRGSTTPWPHRGSATPGRRISSMVPRATARPAARVG